MTQEETRQGVRRRVRLSVVAPVAALACLVAIMLGPSMLGLSLFGAGDLISSRAPWVEGNPSTQIANRCVADTIDSTIPSLLSTKARIFDGDLVPLWEDSASGGATLAATPAQGVTSPLAMAALLAPDPAVTAWLKFFEIAAIALGMVLWARRLGLSIGAGAVGALVFATSAFMVLWTNWPQTRTAAIFPLLFWAVERILQDRTWRSAAPFPWSSLPCSLAASRPSRCTPCTSRWSTPSSAGWRFGAPRRRDRVRLGSAGRCCSSPPAAWPPWH